MILEHVESSRISTSLLCRIARSVELHSCRIRQLIDSLLRRFVVPSAKLHRQLHGQLFYIQLQVAGRVLGIVELFPIRHPDHADFEVLEPGRAAETGNVVRVTVGHDDESELALRRLIQVFDGLDDGTDIAFSRRSFENTTVDQNVPSAGRRWHRNEEEVAESHAIHPHLEAARVSQGRCMTARSAALVRSRAVMDRPYSSINSTITRH